MGLGRVHESGYCLSFWDILFKNIFFLRIYFRKMEHECENTTGVPETVCFLGHGEKWRIWYDKGYF